MRSGLRIGLVLLSAHAAPCLPTPALAGQSTPEVDRISANDNRRAAGELREGVLTLRLEVRTGLLQPEESDGPGLPALAFAEAGRPLQVPGPLIRVPQGTEVRVSVHNPFRDSVLTVYGLHARPTTGEGVLRVPGGQSREVRFRAGTPGTYYYWATTGSSGLDRSWLESQLTGAFVVDPPGMVPKDRIFVIGQWLREADSALAPSAPPQEVLVINGKSWPHTERLTYTQGDSVRWRWINATSIAHPMLH